MLLDGLFEKLKQSAIAKDSTWAIIGSGIGKGCGVLAGIIIARMLGAEVYGQYGAVKSTLAYVATFSTFGLGYTATKYIAQSGNSTKSHIRNIISSSLLTTLVTSAIMAICLLMSAHFIASDPELIPILRYTALVIIFNAVNTVQIGLLSGFKAFRAIAINNTIVGVLTFILAATLTYFYNLEGAVAALFTVTILQCILNNVAIRHHYQCIKSDTTTYKERFNWHTTFDLIRFSFPIALQECVYASANWLRLYVLIHLAGYNEIGLFTATNQWFLIILFIPGILRNVILSHLSSTSETKEHAQTFSTMLKINIVATIIPAVFVALMSPLISRYLYGDSFQGLTPVLLLAVVTSIFGCIAGIYTQEFISRGRNWYILGGYILREYGSLIISIPILYRYGQNFGAVIAYTAILFTHILYCHTLHRKYKKEVINS